MPRDHLGVFNISSDLKFAKGILLLDDCEGTCNWIAAGTDANMTVTYETVAAFMGLKGLQLFSGDADPAEDDYVGAVKWVQVPESGLFVLRTKVGFPDVSDVKSVSIGINLYKDTRLYAAGMRYLPNTPAGAYLNSGGTYTAITEFANAVTDNAWINMELVMDINDLTYVSANQNGVEKDLAGIEFYDSGADTGRMVAISLVAITTGANAATVYFDSIYAGEFINL